MSANQKNQSAQLTWMLALSLALMKKVNNFQKPAQNGDSDHASSHAQAVASDSIGQLQSSGHKLKQQTSIGESSNSNASPGMPDMKQPSSPDQNDQQYSDYEEDSDDSMGLHRFDQEVCLPKGKFAESKLVFHARKLPDKSTGDSKHNPHFRARQN